MRAPAHKTDVINNDVMSCASSKFILVSWMDPAVLWTIEAALGQSSLSNSSLPILQDESFSSCGVRSSEYGFSRKMDEVN